MHVWADRRKGTNTRTYTSVFPTFRKGTERKHVFYVFFLYLFSKSLCMCEQIVEKERTCARSVCTFRSFSERGEKRRIHVGKRDVYT